MVFGKEACVGRKGWEGEWAKNWQKREKKKNSASAPQSDVGEPGENKSADRGLVKYLTRWHFHLSCCILLHASNSGTRNVVKKMVACVLPGSRSDWTEDAHLSVFTEHDEPSFSICFLFVISPNINSFIILIAVHHTHAPHHT